MMNRYVIDYQLVSATERTNRAKIGGESIVGGLSA